MKRRANEALKKKERLKPNVEIQNEQTPWEREKKAHLRYASL